MSRSVVVCGAGGFIGHHLIDRLKREGAWVRGIDLIPPPYAPSAADDYVVGDLRDQKLVASIIDQRFDDI